MLPSYYSLLWAVQVQPGNCYLAACADPWQTCSLGPLLGKSCLLLPLLPLALSHLGSPNWDGSLTYSEESNFAFNCFFRELIRARTILRLQVWVPQTLV